jgi:aspartyl protease family protein
MESHNNDNIVACPHCGNANLQPSKDWMRIMGGGESVCCSNCKEAIHWNQTSGPSGSDKTNNRKFSISFFIISVLLLGFVLYLNRTFAVLSFKKDLARIVYEVLIVLFVSSFLAYGKIGQKFKYLAIWAGIFLILMAGYSYRFELAGVKDKVLAEFIPAMGFQKDPNTISFPVSSDGHFHIRAEVNGIPITFLADTGASHIILSPGDAAKLGIRMDKLDFDRIYETANGNVRGASIQIADLRIGDIHLKAIGASVNGAEMRNSLLGMTFFKRLKSYEVKNDVLTLYWVGQ